MRESTICYIKAEKGENNLIWYQSQMGDVLCNLVKSATGFISYWMKSVKRQEIEFATPRFNNGQFK